MLCFRGWIPMSRDKLVRLLFFPSDYLHYIGRHALHFFSPSFSSRENTREKKYTANGAISRHRASSLGIDRGKEMATQNRKKSITSGLPG